MLDSTSGKPAPDMRIRLDRLNTTGFVLQAQGCVPSFSVAYFRGIEGDGCGSGSEAAAARPGNGADSPYSPPPSPPPRTPLSLALLPSRLRTSFPRLLCSITDKDGRCSTLLPPSTRLEVGIFKITFFTNEWWKNKGVLSFYPFIEVRPTCSLPLSPSRPSS